MKYLFTALLFFCQYAYGQKIELIKVDDFDSTKTIYTNVETIGKNLQVHISHSILKEDTIVLVYFLWTTEKVTVLNKDTEITLLFEGGGKTVIKNRGIYEVISSGETANVNFTIADDKTGNITTKPISKIRISTRAANKDVDIEKKNMVLDMLSLINNAKK